MDTKSWAPTGAWTVYEAAATWETLKTHAETSGQLELDLGAITDIDTTGVQLLIMARRLCRQRGGELRLLGCSEPVRQAMRLYGYGRRAGADEATEVACP